MTHRTFTSQDHYEAFYSMNEHSPDVVDIIETATHYSSDLTTDCVGMSTAIRRFFIGVKHIPDLIEWADGFMESVKSGCLCDVESFWNEDTRRSERTGNWAYGVEGEPGNWYVFLNRRKSA
ncbi:MAG: hypothetical protein LBL73_05345 [Synergistaceae bacterium]|nr:hypothetical protein [Synergistaceae bacterium]